jgi:hypothetical protein
VEWRPDEIAAGFQRAVAGLPDGEMKAALARASDAAAESVRDRATERFAADDVTDPGYRALLEDAESPLLTRRDARMAGWIARASAKRVDVGALDGDALAREYSPDALAEETETRLIRASFDAPSWIGGDEHERRELERRREDSLEDIVDAAAAMVRRFEAVGDAERAAKKKDEAGNKKREKQKRTPEQRDAEREDARRADEVLKRVLAYAALRRGGDAVPSYDEDDGWDPASGEARRARFDGTVAPAGDRTKDAAARVVTLRHAFRRATKATREVAKAKPLEFRDARCDAALLCGDERWRLVRVLAEEKKTRRERRDDEKDKDAAREKELDGDAGTERMRDYEPADAPLLDAALGLAGFDDAFEKKVRKAPNKRPRAGRGGAEAGRARRRRPVASRAPPRLVDFGDFGCASFFSRRRVATPNVARTVPALLPPRRAVHARTRSFQKRDTNVGFILGHLRETPRSLPPQNTGTLSTFEMSSVIVPGGHMLVLFVSTPVTAFSDVRASHTRTSHVPARSKKTLPDSPLHTTLFPSQMVRGGICSFAALSSAAAGGSAVSERPPFLLPPFDPGADPALTAADAAAFRPDATLQDIASAYERAIVGDGAGAEALALGGDSDDEEPLAEGDDFVAAEIRHLDAYVALIALIRDAARLASARGDRRRAEDYARFAARFKCPAPLLMMLPAHLAASDARAASVELAAAEEAGWREALRAHEETRRTLAPEEGRRGEGGGDEGEDGDGGLGGFFLDVTPGDERAEVERAAALAEALGASDAGAGLRGDALDAEEEADLAAMLARNRVALGIGGGGGGEGDVLAGLEREEETLEQMRRASGRG